VGFKEVMPSLRIFLLIAAVIIGSISEAFRLATRSSHAIRNGNKLLNKALMMADAEAKVEVKKDKKGGKPAPKDLSGFSVGQTLEGKVVSVKAFGAFVEVPGGANVLLPRSVISRGGKFP